MRKATFYVGLVVISTDYLGSCKSNYHSITITIQVVTICCASLNRERCILHDRQI